jgi:putative ABC transport system permease protein
MRELRFAIRALRQAPGFALAAIVTTALGIGAATAIFSVVYGILLRPLPYRDADRLVVIEAWQRYSGGEVRENFSQAAVRPFKEHTRSFDATSFVSGDLETMTVNGATDVVDVDIVTPGFFELLGGRFAAGRPFTAAEDAAPVAVISARVWQQAYGGSAAAIGRAAVFDGHSYTIVGVTDDSFRTYDPRAAAYLTAGYARSVKPGQFGPDVRRGGFNPIARLAPGVTRQQAIADVTALIRSIDVSLGRPDRQVRANVVPLRDQLVAGVRPALLMLFAAVGLVLLVACANVANLMLTRSAARAKDTAVRRALGASSWQLARQTLAESAVVAVLGSVLGAVLAGWLARALVALQGEAMPVADAVRVDLPALAFAALAAIAAALIAGVVPVPHAANTSDALKVTASTSTGRGARRVRATLISAELALSLVLLVGASLVGRSLLRLVHADVGVPTDHIAAVLLDLTRNGPVDEAARQRIVGEIVARVSETPGVVHAGVGTSVPPNRSRARFTMNRAGVSGPGADYAVDAAAVTPRFFATLGVPLERGRFFTDADDATHPPVAIMTAATARDLIGEGDPIGRNIELASTREGHVQATVVGIVGDIKYSGLDAAAGGTIYRPFAQQSWPTLFVLARTSGDPTALLPQIRRTIGGVDRAVSIVSMNTIDGFIADATAQPRFRTFVLIGLASLAVALAAVGVYGVVAYAVSQRTTEIGIRMALGATRADVVGLVIRDAIGMAGAGLVAGVALSVLAARALGSLLYGVGPTDAASFIGSAIALVAVTMAATYMPARRAARVDPIVALRDE